MINHYKVTGNYKAKLQTPIAITFFTRSHTLKKTFYEVKKARPQKLFLIQDGKREKHKDDWNNIISCRKIVEDIDWDKMEDFNTYAVLRPDGEWIEPGEMGWWGVSYATPEEEERFMENYKNAAI